MSDLLPGYFYKLRQDLLVYNTDEDAGFTSKAFLHKDERILILSMTIVEVNVHLKNSIVVKFLSCDSLQISCDIIKPESMTSFIENYLRLDEEIHVNQK